MTSPERTFEVELPAGGRMALQSIEEVDLFEGSRDKYIDDYHLMQQNDLNLLGAILTQQLVMFRAQQRLNGMEPELDAGGVPTGRYRHADVKPSDVNAAHNTVIKAAEQILELEKALAIDKKTRESGGTHTVSNYVDTLKYAARTYGIHLSKRVREYERVAMEARWKLRVLRNGDPEDRSYHGLTEKSICQWLEEELDKLEEVDKQFAREKGRLFVGKL